MSSSFHDIAIENNDDRIKMSTPTTLLPIAIHSSKSFKSEDHVNSYTSPPSDVTTKETKNCIITDYPLSIVDEKEGFCAKQSRRLARKPCWYFLTCLITSIILSIIAMIVGDFSVSANTGGWQSRGTMIANRQTQVMIIEFYQSELFYGDGAAWERLLNNVLSGWEDDDDTDTDNASDQQRSLANGGMSTLNYNHYQATTIGETIVDYLRPQSDFIDIIGHSSRKLPFELTPQLHRKLQINLDERGCDLLWYGQTNLTQDVHLWPMWKSRSSNSHSVLDPTVLRDICEAETNTQTYLEANDLCFGCEVGCLPPYSLVMFARLIVDNGWTLPCADLANSWALLQTDVVTELTTCVEDIKKQYDPDSVDQSFPIACPLYFYTTLIAEDFDLRGGISEYTSSIFATRWTDVITLYDAVEHFDTAESSTLVEGSYDTQYEDFVGFYLDHSLANDMVLAMGSAVVVATAIIMHTRSPFMTLIGLLQIILSFPLSYLVYKLMAGLDFFPFLNFIGIFVVFALGAGDIFVAVDKWKNGRLKWPSARTEDIAAKVLPDAAVAMFLTTFTTAVAFFATAICPVAPIKMFAIFCGLLVTFDYIMNVLLIFPALCIYDRAIKDKGIHGVSCFMSFSCFGMLQKRHDTRTKISNGNTTRGDDDDLEETATTIDTSNSPRDTKRSVEQNLDSKASLIRRILSTFYDMLHMTRWPLFVACTAALGVSIYYASTLELPTSSDVRLLDDSSQFERNYLWRQHLLSSALGKASGSQAYMIWGVKAADTGDHNDPGQWSKLVLDPTFDSSSEESQIFLRDFCTSLLAEDFANPVDTDYTCPLLRFDRWLSEQSNATNPTTEYTQNCNDATGIPMSSSRWDSCVTAWSKLEGDPSILTRNGKLTIVVIPFTSRVRYDDRFDTLDDEWNLIETWVKNRNANAPQGVQNGYFSSFDFWWYDTNGQMLSTAYSAAGMALGCAAAVILFTSQSLVLTCFCTVTIGYVLSSVTATLVAMGWTLGFLESICFAILIGVSVDFVIHLGHAYSTAADGDVDRGFRTHHALISMGPSILATAMTTILSAVVMLFTVITFFQKFDLILFFTVLQASIGSFIVFLTMADCIGPSNPTYVVNQIKHFCSRG